MYKQGHDIETSSDIEILEKASLTDNEVIIDESSSSESIYNEKENIKQNVSYIQYWKMKLYDLFTFKSCGSKRFYQYNAKNDLILFS